MSGQPNGNSVILSEKSYQEINRYLGDFVQKSRASLCVFADMNGYPVSYKTTQTGVNVDTLTALAVNDFSATAEIAKILGETQRFRYLYHEGIKQNLYLCNIGDHYLLIVIFGSHVNLGMIRMLSQHVAGKLDVLLSRIRNEKDKVAEFMDVEFRTLLGRELDKAFGLKN